MDLQGWAVLLVVIFLVIFSFAFFSDDIKKKKEKQNSIKQEQQEIIRFDENLKRLEKLGSLYKDGIISKEEFEEKRKKYKL